MFRLMNILNQRGGHCAPRAGSALVSLGFGLFVAGMLVMARLVVSRLVVNGLGFVLRGCRRGGSPASLVSCVNRAAGQNHAAECNQCDFVHGHVLSVLVSVWASQEASPRLIQDYLEVLVDLVPDFCAPWVMCLPPADFW